MNPIRRRQTLVRALLAVVLLAVLASGLRQVLLRQLYPFPHRDVILEAARAQNLDPYLVAAVIRAESKWDPDAVSPKGARGLMQVLPATGAWAAREMGLEAYSDERLFEPETNIRVGTWYLADLRDEFGGDWVLVLAAYNGGRRTVRSWLEAGRIGPPGASDPDRIPYAETRAYVHRVLAGWERYRSLYARRTG